MDAASGSDSIYSADLAKHRHWRSPITATARSRDRQSTLNVILQPLSSDDLQGYHDLHADSRVWEHLPTGRHTTLKQSRDELSSRVMEWEKSISYWSVKDETGTFLGVGGAKLLKDGLCWNLYYRVCHDWWGCGIAAVIARYGFQAAKITRPDLPIVAYLLEHNVGSRKIAERTLGLTLQWRGPDAGNPDGDAIRLVYSDRPLDEETLDIVIK